jgi:hypothetical protein
MTDKQNSVTFSCVCDPGEEMDFRRMMDHMREAHGEDVEGKQVQSEMQSHIDGASWHATVDKITTGGGNVFFRHVVCER